MTARVPRTEVYCCFLPWCVWWKSRTDKKDGEIVSNSYRPSQQGSFETMNRVAEDHEEKRELLQGGIRGHRKVCRIGERVREPLDNAWNGEEIRVASARSLLNGNGLDRKQIVCGG